MKKTIALIAILLLLPSFAFAATFGSGEDYTLPSSQTTPGNHYAAGANVNIDGIVNGDLFAAAGNVYLNNSVANDATIAGGNLFIQGEIGDDLRIAGGNVSIFAPVNGELMAAGGIVKLGSKAIISKDAYIAGGKLVIDGPIKGNAIFVGDEIYINSEITGSVSIEAENITFGDNALISGNLNYKSNKELTLTKAQVNGEIIFSKFIREQKDDYKHNFNAFFAGLLFVKFLTALIFAFVLFAIFRKYTTKTVEESIKKFGMSLLTGLLVVILVPIITLLLLITVLGIPFALILMAYFGIIIILAKTFAGILLGTLIFKIFKKKDIINWWTILVGIIAIHLLMLIPIIGWIACTILFLTALGVLYYQTVEDLKRLR